MSTIRRDTTGLISWSETSSIESAPRFRSGFCKAIYILFWIFQVSKSKQIRLSPEDQLIYGRGLPGMTTSLFQLLQILIGG